MKLLLALLLAYTLCSCTIYHTPDKLGSMLEQCETVECVVTQKDLYKDGPTNDWFKRYKFMEGYPPQSLQYMMDTGRLTIRKMNPAEMVLAIAGPVLGVAKFVPTIYGDMSRCSVIYADIPGWRSILNHELDHCLGYADVGISPDALANDYTDTQKAIMREEGVSRWIDTRFYREQMFRFYDEEENFYFYTEQ